VGKFHEDFGSPSIGSEGPTLADAERLEHGHPDFVLLTHWLLAHDCLQAWLANEANDSDANAVCAR
jgi:hypothetical protein